MTTDQISVILYRLDRQDEALARIETHAKTTDERITTLEFERARDAGVKRLLAVWTTTLILVFSSSLGGLAVYFFSH
jgi:hypothetical protein